jgi:hypothetical protein
MRVRTSSFLGSWTTHLNIQDIYYDNNVLYEKQSLPYMVGPFLAI